MDRIEELRKKLKGIVQRWEEEVLTQAHQMARSMDRALLEKMDEELMETKEKGFKVIGFRERWITALFGDIKIRRRLYRDSSGKSHFLLDEAIGWRERSQASSKVEELSTFLSSHLPFEKCERLLRALLPDGISHTIIHRLVGRVVGPYLKEEEEEIAEVFEGGVIPESEGKVVPHILWWKQMDQHCPATRGRETH